MAMKTRRAGVGQVIFLLAVLCGVAAAESPKLTFKFTIIKVKGAQSTALYGINSGGVMVGSYVDSGGVRHGFQLTAGKVKNIDDPNGTDTYCLGINKTGAIVGWYAAATSHAAQGFLYQKGKFSDLGPSGSMGSQAIGINDHGDINGNYGDSSGVSHGFLLKAGKYTTQDVPNASNTLGGGINNAGLITEVWLDSSFNANSSLYDGKKKYTKINIPGEPDSDAGGINNLGDVVYSWEAAETYGGALRHGGKYYKFHVPHGDRTFGYGINDKKVIVGAFTTDSQVLEGFTATYK
jgi:probable HAF family extracellular repeat protein